MIDARILLVGCGKMGQSMVGGWLQQGITQSKITIIEPNTDLSTALEQRFKQRFSIYADVNHIPEAEANPDIIVIAVKPQIMQDVLPSYRMLAEQHNALILSIAAGKTISFIGDHFVDSQPIVRVMPNLPALISKGVTVACKNRYVNDAQHQLTTKLLEAIGVCHWVEDETLLDAVTAVSGSGPAYLFYFLECLVEAGVKLGLSQELATSLAYLTVNGSTELALQSDQPASALREQVTSKGGTTEAALKVLMSDGLDTLIAKATKAAKDRSEELSS